MKMACYEIESNLAKAYGEVRMRCGMHTSSD